MSYEENRIIKYTQSIQLDCAPGAVRPGDLYPAVIEGLGLPTKTPCSMFFGQWTWDYSEIPSEKWKELQPTLKDRIVGLYDAGFIRYGSW